MNEDNQNIASFRSRLVDATNYPETKVTSEMVNPLTKFAEKQPENVQKTWATKAGGLTQPDESAFKTRFDTDVPGHPTTKTLVEQRRKDPSAYVANIGFFNTPTPGTDPTRFGEIVHTKAKELAERYKRNEFQVFPKWRTPSYDQEGVQVFSYTTDAPRPVSKKWGEPAPLDPRHHMSHITNLFNDFMPVSMEEEVETGPVLGKKDPFGFEEHLNVHEDPNPYGFKKRYDARVVGRKGTPFEGIQGEIDYKSGKFKSQYNTLDEVKRKAAYRKSEMSFAWLINNIRKEPIGFYGMFDTDVGALTIVSNVALEKEFDDVLKKEVEIIHKTKSAWPSINDVIANYS